jgi:hypothetical protein
MKTALKNREQRLGIYRRYYRRHRLKLLKARKEYYDTNRKEIRNRKLARNLQIKFEVLAHYGPRKELRCSWRGCAIVDVDMLSLDHVKNDGFKHRHQHQHDGSQGGVGLYSRLRNMKYPKGFQTLCYNHQMKKELVRRSSEAL